MVTAEFQPFFLASVGASAALIGLLFVSVSIAPERVFGQQSDVVRQAQALSAFTALTNIFFTSMLSLIPGIVFGLVVTFVSIPAILQTLALLGHARHWRDSGIILRGAFLFLASAAVYGYELVLGIQLWQQPASKNILVSIVIVLIGAYAIGLGRAWELLGAPRSGVVSTLVDRLSRRLSQTDAPKKP